MSQAGWSAALAAWPRPSTLHGLVATCICIVRSGGAGQEVTSGGEENHLAKTTASTSGA